MLRILHWQSATKKFLTDDSALPVTAALLPEGDVVWIDLADPTPEEEARIFGTFLPVHPLTLEDITRSRRLPDQGAHLAKVEEFPEYLFVIVNPLPWEACHPNHKQDANPAPKIGWKRRQLSGLLTPQVLITQHYDPLPCVETQFTLTTRRNDSFGRGPDYLFHLILDEMVDEYAPVVERFAGRLSRIESKLFEKPDRESLTQLLRLKRRVLFLRKTLVLEREVLARLVRGEFELVNDREMHYYRNVYDHLVRYTELIENAREMVSDLMQLHVASVSNKLNEVMKVLTMISTVVLPMTLVAGVYGMNFHTGMPELNWEYGYAFALGLMAAVGFGALALFRWKRWL